jgi:hypothetical protein
MWNAVVEGLGLTWLSVAAGFGVRLAAAGFWEIARIF